MKVKVARRRKETSDFDTMLAPDVQLMVHSPLGRAPFNMPPRSEVLDDEGYVHRGSRLTELATNAAEPPEWRLRDFAFAAYSGPNAPGLRQAVKGEPGSVRVETGWRPQVQLVVCAR